MPDISFIHPRFLYALPLALAPLIIHLIFRRTFPLQLFSTFFILRRFANARMKQLRLQNLLLIILRTLIIIFIILLFARPALRTRGGNALSGSGGSHLVVLDDSYSMNRRLGDSTVFAAARAGAGELLQSLPAGARCALLSATRPANSPWLHSPAQALVRVKNARSTFLAARYSAVGEAAGALARESQSSVVYLYFFSDFQASYGDSLQTLLSHKTLQGRNVEWILVNVAPRREARQLWADSAYVPFQVIDPAGTVQLTASCRIAGEKLPTSCLADVYARDERVWQKRIPIEQGEFTTLALVPLRAPGMVYGKIAFDYDDDLPGDNMRYFSFYCPPTVRLVIVSSGVNTAQYLSAALTPAGEQRGLFNVSACALSQLGTGAAREADVLWFCDVPYPSMEMLEAVRNQLSRGKGVIVSLASTCDLAAYNRQVTGVLGAGQLVQAVSSGSGTFFLLNQLKNRLPLFTGFGERMKEDILFYGFCRITPAPQATTHAYLSDGSPFVVESHPLGGTFMLIAGSVTNDSTTNIMNTGFYVPFVNRAALFASGSLRRGVSFSTGAPLRVEPEKGVIPSDPLLRIDPDGQKIKVPLASAASGSALVFEGAERPGNYRFVCRPGDTSVVSVNIERRESNLAPLPAQKLAELASQVHGTVVDGQGRLGDATFAARRGSDVFLHVLAMLCLCLLGEAYLSNRVAG